MEKAEEEEEEAWIKKEGENYEFIEVKKGKWRCVGCLGEYSGGSKDIHRHMTKMCSKPAPGAKEHWENVFLSKESSVNKEFTILMNTNGKGPEWNYVRVSNKSNKKVKWKCEGCNKIGYGEDDAIKDHLLICKSPPPGAMTSVFSSPDQFVNPVGLSNPMWKHVLITVSSLLGSQEEPRKKWKCRKCGEVNFGDARSIKKHIEQDCASTKEEKRQEMIKKQKTEYDFVPEIKTVTKTFDDKEEGDQSIVIPKDLENSVDSLLLLSSSTTTTTTTTTSQPLATSLQPPQQQTTIIQPNGKKRALLVNLMPLEVQLQQPPQQQRPPEISQAILEKTHQWPSFYKTMDWSSNYASKFYILPRNLGIHHDP